jgi:hypothetical protein
MAGLVKARPGHPDYQSEARIGNVVPLVIEIAGTSPAMTT